MVVQSSRTTRCPACGGEVHAIAGRCKHCKHDLVQFRAQQALAAQAPQVQQVQQPQPQARAPRPVPVNGTPPVGVAPTQRPPAMHQAPYPVAAPRRRWPLWVGGAALFLLGLSAGVMIERWRTPDAEAAATSEVSPAASSPRLVPDSIPTDPILPDPSPAPPPNTTPAPPSGGVNDVTAFIERFGTLFCDKAIECGLFESSNRGLCEAAVAQSRDPNASAKLARGDCTFNASAASRCLATIENASCDPSIGADQMATLLATSMLECERAYSCR